MIQKDEYRAGQGYRNIRGWSFSCRGCGFRSHVYKSRDMVEVIEQEHEVFCSVASSDLTQITIIKSGLSKRNAVPRARMPTWE